MKRLLLILMFFPLLLSSGYSQTSDFRPCIGSDGTTGLSNLRLLIARSTNGLNWTKTYTVLADRSSVADAVVLEERILIYFVAGCEIIGATEQPTNSIKLAYSDDRGKSWIYKNVLFNNLPVGGTLPVDPNVQLMPDGVTIYMLVTIDPDQSGPEKPCSYSAISTDGGFTFTIQNIAFQVAGQEILDPENMRLNDTIWYVWSGGIPGKNLLGLSSDDGASFIYQNDFCAAMTQDFINCYIVADAEIFKNQLKMYAFGDATGTGTDAIISFSSCNGQSWVKDSGIRLQVDAPSTVEDMKVWAPTVVMPKDSDYVIIYETNIPAAWTDVLDSVRISPGDTFMYTGDTLYLQAKGFYSDGTRRDLTSFASWNSSNSSVAGFANPGMLVAGTIGTTLVSASDDLVNSNNVNITVLPTVVDESDRNPSGKIILYPNPATTTAMIRMYFEESSELSLSICNITGQNLKTCFEGLAQKGWFGISVPTENLSPGIYNIMVKTKDTIRNIKFTKLNN